MNIKRYEATTAKEALDLVKKDLGPDAIILHTRRSRRGGLFGFMGQEVVEITAGADLVVPDEPTRSGRLKPVRVLKPVAQVHKLRIRARELNEMKVLGSPGRRGTPAAVPASISSTAAEDLVRDLCRSGVSENLAQRMVNAVHEPGALSRLEGGQAKDPKALRLRLREEIAQTLRTVPSLEGKSDGPLVVALVGPTGVGKTTTLAKIAAQAGLVQGRSVAMITADTYRVAATEQLKTYARIIGAPVEVVVKPKDMRAALAKHRDKRLILIDTAGRSPKHSEQLIELKSFMEAAHPDEVHLILSATTKYYDVLGIVEKFGIVPINRVIFTKIDETSSYGLILSVCANFGFPVSYIATGQKVPDDLERASRSRLAGLVVPEPGPVTRSRPSDIHAEAALG